MAMVLKICCRDSATIAAMNLPDIRREGTYMAGHLFPEDEAWVEGERSSMQVAISRESCRAERVERTT